MRFKLTYYFALASILLLMNCQQRAANSIEQLYRKFQKPEMENLPVVYWFWNGEMNPDTIRYQLEQMKKSRTVSGAVIMAWEGLSIEYLSDLWFERVKFACDIAHELGLKIWLYDEYLWPSGYAGGKALETFPELHARCLARDVHDVPGNKTVSIAVPESTIVVAVCQKSEGEFKIIHWQKWEESDKKYVWQAPPGDWQVNFFYEQNCQFHPTFSEKGYVDLLKLQTAKRFMVMTHERYYSIMPEYFGNTIEAIITDEPGFYCNLGIYGINPGAVAFTPDLFDQFKNEKKYDLRQYLPALWENVGKSTAAVRRDFYDFLAKRFKKSYLEPLQNWCQQHKIKLNVQPVHEETMKFDALLQGDYFQVMSSSDLPGCDEVYGWDKTNLTPLLASSAARLLGKSDVYCEVFGAYGWDLSIGKMKLIADWLFARGINHLQLSSFYYSVNNENWRMEIPPSLFYQNTQWRYLANFTDYCARLTTVLGKMRLEHRIGLYRPKLSLRSRLAISDEDAADELDKQFNSFANALLGNQISFLILDDYFLSRNSKVMVSQGKAKLLIPTGQANIELEALILPYAEVLSKSCLNKIVEFNKAGGKVYWFGNTPQFSLSDAGAPESMLEPVDKKAISGAHFSSLENLIAALDEDTQLKVKMNPGTSAIEMIHGVMSDAEIYFFSNNDGMPWQGQISLQGKGDIEIWDAATGERRGVLAQQRNNYLTFEAHFAPYGSKLIILQNQNCGKEYEPEYRQIKEFYLSDEWHFSPANGAFPGEIRKSGSWTEAQERAAAHPYFSGTGIYRATFDIPGADLNEEARILLIIEDVKEIAEVHLNGKLVGVRCWQPYEYDLTPFLQKEGNELEIHVTNTPANSYMLKSQKYIWGENWGKIVNSGIMGRTKVVIQTRQ